MITDADVTACVERVADLAAHVDTLGAMVRPVKTNGRLRFTRVGGYPELYVVCETCRIHTRDGREYTGTFQPVNPAVHVNPKIGEYRPQEETIEVVVDLPVENKDEVESYGIRVGDFISLDPGVSASHGYERTHADALASTLRLLERSVSAVPASTAQSDR